MLGNELKRYNLVNLTLIGLLIWYGFATVKIMFTVVWNHQQDVIKYKSEKSNNSSWGVAIAQWICLRLPSYLRVQIPRTPCMLSN